MPLHIASSAGFAAPVEILIFNNANLTAVDKVWLVAHHEKKYNWKFMQIKYLPAQKQHIPYA